MNLQQLRYVVEIEKTNSITGAAKNLFMGQPNLSKSVKELENEIGITLFNRTAKGVEPTSGGLQFLRYAKTILEQMDELESLYKPQAQSALQFSLSVPRATYISVTFSRFLNNMDCDTPLDIQYKETNSVSAVTDVSTGCSSLGIIRYQNIY
ncbi:MAG: LysR family transcriptional regulator, partial [Oscillospiraceae bacterium]|nr:LysR family transcriptional regulator [Oscillospiraceae bacterium]